MAETGHSQSQDVGTAKQIVTVNKTIRYRIFHHLVATGNMKPRLRKAVHCLADPPAFGGPICHRRSGSFFFYLLRVDRVERKFHLVDRDVVGPHLDRLLDTSLPIRLGLTDHPGDQINVDLGKTHVLDPLIRTEDFRRQMGTTIFFQYRVVEIFDAQRHACYANFGECLHLVQAQGPRLAFERDLAGGVPRK